MALLPSEVTRLRYETGYNVLTIGAEPYISYHALFDQVIVPYLSSGAVTTSSTYVAAVTDEENPPLVGLTLASVANVTAGDTIWIDLGKRQERTTIQAIVGSVAHVLLLKTHGVSTSDVPYPVTVEGGEAIIRQLLNNIQAARDAMSLAGESKQSAAILASGGGLKKVDEIEFYSANPNFAVQAGAGGSLFANLNDQIKYWRKELCNALNIQNLWDLRKGSGGGSVALY